MSLRCSICGATWERIPADAVQIGRGSVSPLYRLSDGSIHAIGSRKLGKRKKSTAVTAKEK